VLIGSASRCRQSMVNRRPEERNLPTRSRQLG
jgi:hypothetical protein